MHKMSKTMWVLQDRGSRGLCLERVYRLLYDPELHLASYGKIYRNDGAMTPGITKETADGMSLEKIHDIVAALRRERFKWTPVKRVYIPKKNAKLRPLGLPTWSDKLVQESLRTILEAYYEPQFSDCSFGFRPNCGCQTALAKIARTWTGTTWFIEGDIAGCFDNIDHQELLSILREKIRDGRFIELVSQLLRAGYLEDWSFHSTLSGARKAGLLARSSPISTLTGWTSSSNRRSCRSLIKARCVAQTRLTTTSRRWPREESVMAIFKAIANACDAKAFCRRKT